MDDVAVHRPNVFFVALFAVIVLLAGCGGSPNESSARAAVAEMRGGEFMQSDSAERFRIDTVSVEGGCAVAEIMELPSRHETSIFMRWDGRSWVRTKVVAGHDLAFDVSADDCWRL
jgi:hypothetical protein